MIPDNGEFPDMNLPNNADYYHHIAQWHDPLDKEFDHSVYNHKEPVFFTYIHDSTSNSTERSLLILYGTKEQEHKSIIINKGKWNDITLQIKWSADDNGFMKVYLNGVLQQTLHGANLKRTTTGEIFPNYFKAGHYRNNHNERSTLYFDEFRIGTSLEQVNLRTKLINEDCGSVLGFDDMMIKCHEVIGAKGYHFYFPDQDEIVYSESPSIDLAQLNWVDLNTTYKIQCRVALYDGFNKTDLFGTICQVTTPPSFKTKLKDEDCGSTLPSNDLTVEAYPVSGATQYKFYVSGITNPIERSQPNLNLGDYSWFNFNSSYQISARVSQPDNAGLINHIGESCTVYSPLKTRLKDEYCGSTLSSNSLTVEAYSIPGVTQYKFYVSGITNPIERNEPKLNLGDYDWFNFNSSYQISVRVSQPANAGLINHIGESCTVSSSSPSARVSSGNNIMDSNTFNEDIMIYPNPSDGIITIDGIRDLESIKLFNVGGQEIKFTSLKDGDIFSVKTEFKGLILLHLLKGNDNRVFKIRLK